MDVDLGDELEWAARQYSVAVDYLLATLAKAGDLTPRIDIALADLVAAINEEWGGTSGSERSPSS